MKIKKENYVWIFSTVMMALLLALSIYLGISGWYFKTDYSYTTDLELGKNVQLGVKKNQANSISMNLDGSYLSGDRLPQLISIKNMDDETSVYLRAKIYIYTGDNQTLKMDMVETVNWVFDERDNYFYFDDILAKNNKVALCSHLIIDNETHLQTDTKYIVTIIVEALGKDEDVVRLWGKNPIENI